MDSNQLLSLIRKELSEFDARFQRLIHDESCTSDMIDDLEHGNCLYNFEEELSKYTGEEREIFIKRTAFMLGIINNLE